MKIRFKVSDLGQRGEPQCEEERNYTREDKDPSYTYKTLVFFFLMIKIKKKKKKRVGFIGPVRKAHYPNRNVWVLS